MKAAIFHGPGRPVTIEHVADPVAGPDDVVVKVHRCGICGSDVSMTDAVPFTFQPGRLGHEYAGEIVAVGRDVTGLKIGQRVACRLSVPCGVCPGCKLGHPVFCQAPRRAADGGGGFGGFGEYVSMPAPAALPLSDGLSFADGALVEPMSCGLHAFRMARLDKGASVLVLGAGSMAFSTLYWARRLGAGRIVVAARSRGRAEVAGALGADAFHSFAEDDPAELNALLGGQPDVVVECVGREGMLGKAIELVRPGGTVISLGVCQHSEPILPAVCAFKDLRMFFPLAYTNEEYAETLRAFEADSIKPDFLVSDVIALEALPQVLEDLRAGRLSGHKIQVDPQMGAANA